MASQRKQDRFDWEIDIGVEWAGGIRAARTRNVSLGGLSATMAEPPPFGTETTIHLRLPGLRDTYRIPSIVRWSRPGVGFGVQFVCVRAIEVWALTRALRRFGLSDAE